MQNRQPCFIRFGSLPVLATVGLLCLSAALPEVSSRRFSRLFLGLSPAIAQNIDEDTNIRVYKAASPAVVAIDAGNGNGSGSLVTPTGLVLTNAHVVGSASRVQVRLEDGREFVGDVVGYANNRVDLAAIQLRGNPTGLPTLQIAPRDSVQVGQRAFVIGNPFGLSGTFTVGIVSRIDPVRRLIQTDAAINPGNSGGPLLNSRGQLMGVNTSIFTTERRGGNIGIGFAIPVEEVQSFLSALQNGTAPTQASASNGRGRVPPEPIRLNNTVAGRLGRNSDVLPDGSYYNAYVFEGQEGQQVAIEMASQELDSYLILLSQGNDSLYLEDDDGAGNYNARMEVTLPVDGLYVIIANSYAGGQEGRYSLRLRELAQGRSTPPPATASQYILRQEGQLTTGDEVATDDSLFDRYPFEGIGGQSVTITLESGEFNTYLALMDAAGEILAQNNDIAANNTNSQIRSTLPNTGTYYVIVNGYTLQDRGRYTLTVRE